MQGMRINNYRGQTSIWKQTTESALRTEEAKTPIWKLWKLKSSHYLSWLWILILAVYAATSAVRSIVKNYQEEKEIKAISNEINHLKLEKTRLEALTTYYSTDTYKEKEIRRRLLLRKPEEYVIAFPELNKPTQPEETQVKVQSERANYEKWLDYFLKRK